MTAPYLAITQFYLKGMIRNDRQRANNLKNIFKPTGKAQAVVSVFWLQLPTVPGMRLCRPLASLHTLWAKRKTSAFIHTVFSCFFLESGWGKNGIFLQKRGKLVIHYSQDTEHSWKHFWTKKDNHTVYGERHRLPTLHAILQPTMFKGHHLFMAASVDCGLGNWGRCWLSGHCSGYDWDGNL